MTHPILPRALVLLTIVPCAAQQSVPTQPDVPATRSPLQVIGQTTLPGSEILVGVCLAGDRAICSFFDDGLQRVVDISNPAAPSVCSGAGSINAPYWDQWNEGLYYEGFGGLFFSGHRGGGLSVLNASNPCSGMPIFDTVSTTYHFKGLRVWEAPGTVAARAFLFYAEHPAFGTAGGLRVFEVDGGGVTPVGGAFKPNTDGGELVVTSDGRWCFQHAPGGRFDGINSLLRVYEIPDLTAANPGPIVERGIFDIPGNVRDFNSDMVLSPDDQTAYLTIATDGLHIMDVSVPTAPVFLGTWQGGGDFSVRGLTVWAPGELLLWGRRVSDGQTVLLKADISNPAAPRVTARVTVPGMIVSDVEVRNGMAYVAGRDLDDVPMLQIRR